MDVSGFAHHIGPVLESSPGHARIVLAPHHLNFADRMHGAMMMLMLTTAAESKAKAELLGRASDQSLQLICADFGFVRSAHVGAAIAAEARIERATRTLMFLSAQVLADGEALCTATMTFALVPLAAVSLRQPQGEAHPAAGTNLRVPSNLLGHAIGDIHDQAITDHHLRAEFEVSTRRCQAGQPLLDNGMTMYVADSVGSRAANRATGQGCVTVNLQLRRFADAPLGAWVRLETQVRQVLGDLIFVEGQFTVEGQALADFSGIWKGMGPARSPGAVTR